MNPEKNDAREWAGCFFGRPLHPVAEFAQTDAMRMEREGWGWARANLSPEMPDEEWLKKALAEHKRRGLTALCLRGPNGGTLLHVVAGTGNAEKVRLLMDWVDVDARNINQQSALSIAIEKNHLECVQALSERCDLSAKTAACGGTVLHDAARLGHAEIVQFLAGLPESSGIHALDQDGGTPLHWAASRGNVECARILMEKYDAGLEDEGGMSALIWAAVNDHVSVLSLVMKAHPGRKSVKAGASAAMFAIQNNALKSLALLLPENDWSAKKTRPGRGQGDEIFDAVAKSAFATGVSLGDRAYSEMSALVEMHAPLAAGRAAVAKHGAKTFPLLHARIEAADLAQTLANGKGVDPAQAEVAQAKAKKASPRL